MDGDKGIIPKIYIYLFNELCSFFVTNMAEKKKYLYYLKLFNINTKEVTVH